MVKNGHIAKVCLFDLLLNWLPSYIKRYIQLIFSFFVKHVMAIFHKMFLYFVCNFIIRRRRRISIVRRGFIRWFCIFINTISEHCKWIMPIGFSFINERGHKKHLKVIKRTMYFGIPTIEIFLNKKDFGVQLPLY